MGNGATRTAARLELMELTPILPAQPTRAVQTTAPPPAKRAGRQKGMQMIEYHVMLKRFPGSSRPDVCVFRDDNRETALKEMHKYVKQNGFTVWDKDGHYTIENVVLMEKEPIVGAPVLSETPYHELFDD